MKQSYNGSVAASGDRHCIAFSSRDRNRSLALIRLVIAAVALLFVSGCNLIGGDGKSESGIAGDGVTAGGVLSKIGDGSDASWSDNCAVVEEKTEWRWGWWEDNYNSDLDSDDDDYKAADVGSDVTLDEVPKPRDPYIFTIDVPTLSNDEKWGHSQVFITLVKIADCKIDRTTKIAYTTKDWLCKGDQVKVDGKDCTIVKVDD